MWKCLVTVCCAVLAVSRGDDQQQSAFAGLRGAVEPRLAASGLRIARLEHEIEQLDHGIDEAAKIDPRRFLREMHNKIAEHAEHTHPICPKHHVQCSWKSTECVSTLFVCDGHADCHNGWDEDEHTCSHGAIRAGNVFTGTALWVSCLPLREHPVSLKITGVATPKIFPARLFVRAHVSGDVPHLNMHREGDFKGYYIYGKRRLVLGPVAQSGGYLHYGIVCDFHYGDDERADCRLMNEASLHTCATIHMTIEHHDMHHTEHHHDDHHVQDKDHHDDLDGLDDGHVEHHERHSHGHH